MYTLEITAECIGERIRHQGLCKSRVILEQEVTIGQDVNQHIVDNMALSDDYFLHLGTNRLSDCTDGFEFITHLF